MKYYLILSLLLFHLNAGAQSPLWAFNIGSNSDDYSHVVRVAPNGNICIAGKFTGTMDLDPGPGVFNVTSNGLDDIYLACYSPSGSFLWGFGIGGPSYDAVWQMAIDDNSNVIIGGWFQSGGIDFDPGPGVTILPYSGGSGLIYYGDGFVAKYSATGVFQWAYDIGGTTVYDHVNAITTDHANNVYVSGEADDIFTIGSYTFSSGIDGQAFLVKFSSSGSILWAHNFGLPGTASSDCNPWGLKFSNGYIYMGGIFQATSNFDPWGTPAMLTSVGYYDAFIAKYDSNGNFVFVKQIIGSGGYDELLGLTLDASDNYYVTGHTSSATMTFDPSSPGTSTVSAPGGGSNDDIFLAKYNSNGIYQWGTILGGTGDDFGWSVDINNGFLYCTGQFQNTVDMDPSPAVSNLVSAGGDDIYITKYDLNGNYICGFRAGSALSDVGYGLAHDATGNLYATGQFGGTAVDFDPGIATLPLTSNGGTDAYLVKYAYISTSAITGSVKGDTICAGQAAQLTLLITSGGPGPFTITYSDGTSTYTLSGILSGVPFTLSVSPVVTTTYTILSITAFGVSICNTPSGSLLGSATILVNPSPAITVTDSFISCFEVKFTANGGDSIYTWSFGDGNYGNGSIVTHTYSVTGNEHVIISETNHFNCTSTDTFDLAIFPNPVNLGPDIIGCVGTPVTIKSSNNYSGATYLWNNGSTTPGITISSSGTYWLTITINGCTGSDTVKVTFNPLPVVVLGNDTTICAGKTVTIGSPALPGSTYNWSTGSHDSSITVSSGGNYTLTISLNGCSASASQLVNVITGPLDINLGHDTMLCKGQEIVLYVNDASAVWNTGHRGKSITVFDSGIYYVQVTNQCGTQSDTIIVDIGLCDLTFPSAFTPNGDGLNDIIRAIGNLRFYRDYSLSIYNRWGQRVFFTQDIYQGWNGIFNGVKQDLGTYFYMMLFSLEGKNHMLKGDFQLIR